MPDFEFSMGEELLEILCDKLGSEEKIKQWVKDFSEWVDICIDDGDPDYVSGELLKLKEENKKLKEELRLKIK